MVNVAVLVGRLTKDPQVNVTPNNKKVLNFTLAVNRDKENTDFINCVAWERTAELIGQYTHKGSQLGISGKIQTRTRKDKDDRTIYITEVWVNDIMFLDSKKEETQYENPIDVKTDNLPF